MAATVYNGVLQGSGGQHIQTLYTNSTGKNVRIVWNYFKVGNTHPAELGLSIGPSSNPNHGGGQDLDTIEISSQGNFTAGKSLAVQRNDDNTSNNAYGSYGGFFPMELVIANTHKISVNIPPQISSNTNALTYNFVAITED